jgi:hypothetical protein
VCGRTLARTRCAIGRPGRDRGILGKSDRFDRSITDFSGRYADQSEQAFQAFVDAIHTGRLKATEDV